MYAKKENRVILGSIHSSLKNANINQIQLLRSKTRDGKYTSVESRDFADTTLKFNFTEPITGDHFYYKLALINKDDTVFSSPKYLFTLDQNPPAPPTKLAGICDSNGIVKLTWKKPFDKDILGYRVFPVANSTNEEFIEKTTSLSSSPNFVDSLRLDNLTSEVFYTVISVDLNYNQSFKSDTILILKPDTIAPIPCVITGLKNRSRNRELFDQYFMGKFGQSRFKNKLFKFKNQVKK